VTTPRGPRDYADPYLAGVGLGLVLLACFLILGRGLGASGAFASTTATAVRAVAPQRFVASPVFSRYDSGLATEWTLYEVAGLLVGGYVSARFAGRLRVEVERGPRASVRQRLVHAFLGGGAMGAGAMLARGCTSGLALTGGAMLSVGSWVFMIAAFASAYAISPFLKRAWR
jgi:uncharacterized membrane protein YedE/YeeE